MLRDFFTERVALPVRGMRRRRRVRDIDVAIADDGPGLVHERLDRPADRVILVPEIDPAQTGWDCAELRFLIFADQAVVGRV